jgi:hypothetical protein
MPPNSQNTIDGRENNSILRSTRSFAFGYKVERLQEVLYIFLSGPKSEHLKCTIPFLQSHIAQLEASTSSGRAGAVGMLQAILQAMLQGAGPVGCCLKVLRGVLLIGRSACRAFCSWVLVPGVPCYWRSLLLAFCPRSWALRF